MSKTISPPYGVAISFEDQLQEDATIAAMKSLGKCLWEIIEHNPNRPCCHLSEEELQWLAIAAISGWVFKRAEQSKALQKNAEEMIEDVPNGFHGG